MKKLRFLLIASGILLSFFTKAQVQDSVFVMYQRDSAVIPETDPTVLFFQENERLTDAQIAKIAVITRTGKTQKLSVFVKATAEDYPADIVLADLDNDGRKELVIYSHTGGAHCCDEIFVLKNIVVNKYQHAVRLFGGHTVIDTNKVFEYSFTENFGYFFTCYACGYADTSDEAPIPLTSVKMRYNKGKMSLIPGDAELKSTINDNLAKLCEKPYQAIDPDLMQDEGQRKEVAINLAVYYFSFGKNLLQTQQLFNKYYKYPDAKKVWAAFAQNLQSIRNANGF